MTRIVRLCRQRSVLRRLHRFSSPLGYITFSSTTITSTDPGPWTPTVSTSSRSADRDGPLTQTRPDGRSVAAAAVGVQYVRGGDEAGGPGSPGPAGHTDRPAGGHPGHRPGDPDAGLGQALQPEDVVGGEDVEPRGRQPPRHPELPDQRVAGGQGDGRAPRPLPAQLHAQFERLLHRQRPMGRASDGGEGLGEPCDQIVRHGCGLDGTRLVRPRPSGRPSPLTTLPPHGGRAAGGRSGQPEEGCRGPRPSRRPGAGVSPRPEASGG